MVRRIVPLPLVCLCSFLFLFSASLQVRADEAADQYNLAVGLYKQQRWNFASEAFQKFITDFPQHEKVSAAELYLGLSLVKEQKLTEARDQLRPYAEKYPDSKYLPDALYQLAEASYLLNDYETATTDFQVMLEKFPQHALAEWALTYLGNSELKLKKFEEAGNHFQQVLKQFPQGRMMSDAKFGLAQALEGEGQLDNAVEAYRAIIAEKGRHATSAYLKLAALEYERDQFEVALTLYKQFQEAYPRDEQIGTSHLNAGYTYFRMGNYSAARNEFQQSAGTTALKRTADYWMALCYKAEDQFAEAIKILELMATEDRTAAEPERSLQSEVLYHLADSHLRAGDNGAALKLFLELQQKWPDQKIAENALHFACVAAFQADDLDQTSQLMQKFDELYPESLIRLSQQLLKGRLLIARGEEANLQEAVDILQEVLASSTIPRTQTLARLHLAHALTQQKKYEEAMQALKPVVESNVDELHPDEQKDVLLLTGLNAKELGELDQAAKAFEQYLLNYPQDERAAQVFSELLLVRVESEDSAALESLLNQLKTQAETKGLSAESTHLKGLRTAAESAYQAEDWLHAELLFQALVDLSRSTPEKIASGADLSGLAWSQYKQEKWAPSIESFNQLLVSYADDVAYAPEAMLMVGRAQEALKNTTEALAAYAKLRDTWLPPDTTLPAGAEKEGATRYVYLAGLQAARLLKSEKNYNGANQVYGRLLDTFPEAEQHAELLDEWALMNLDAGFYSQADQIYQRLIEDHPDSPLADSARLSLAESDLIAGGRETAREKFEKLLASTESDEKVKEAATYQLIVIATSAEDWERVLELGRDFLKTWPKSRYRTKVETSFLEALLGTNQTTRAEEILSELEEKVPPAERSTELWIMLAEVAFRNKEYGEAMAILSDFRQSGTDRKYLADELEGRIHKQQARFEEARNSFLRVLNDPVGKKSTTGAKAQFLLAETYLIQSDKDYETAQKEYYKVFLSWPFPEWQAPALYQVAQCDEALEQPEKARITYQKLIEDFPKSKYAEQAKTRLEVVGDGISQ
ncbi:MAG: tetratricopeptide repeat protein [Planctomycetaceae bacterium]|nr:tetratricopeptide repeat protein [Planctomycetaceae bacterium]